MTQVHTVPARGVVAVACAVAAASISVTATSSYVYAPIATEFGLDGQAATVLKVAPLIATIVVVFAASTLADRLGRRRLLVWACVAFAIGGLVASLAPAAPFVVVGLSAMGAAASSMVVVAVALLGSSFDSAEARARAFGAFGTVSPFVYLVAPVIAGTVVTYASWRIVGLLWVATGVAAGALVGRLLPPDGPRETTGELVTPLLAGVLLALLVEAITYASDDGVASPGTLLLCGAALVTLAILTWAHRRLSEPSLDLAPLRRRPARLLMAVIIVVPITSLWYTSFLLFEYLFGLTPLVISLVMIPAQLTGMVGAQVMKRVIPRRGLRWSGLGLLTLLALVQAGYLVVQGDGLWLALLLITLYGFIGAALTVVLSNAVMDAAPRDESGPMSSYRSASARIGGALGSLVIGVVLFGAFQGSLDQQAPADGVSGSQAVGVSQALAEGESDTEASTQFSLSRQAVDEIGVMERIAMVDALHAKAAVGVVATLVASGLFAAAVRRRDGDLGLR